MNSHRAHRDLVTNPSYDHLLDRIQQSVNTETERLTCDAQENDIHKVNRQAGILEGTRRVLALLKNYRAQALEEFVADRQPGEGA